MARTGVTYAEIAVAAAQINGNGQAPTVDAVRQILGTGSRTTIANHLKTWKSQQPQSNSDGLPPELLSHIKGLWEQLNTVADSRIHEIEQHTCERVAEMQRILEQERIDYLALDVKHKELTARYHDQVVLSEKFRDDLSQSDQQNAKLETYSHGLQEQLQHHKAENDRLHKINSRIQDNLENVQKDIIKLRQENDSAIEKQKVRFIDEMLQFQKAQAIQSERNNQLEIEKVQILNELDKIKAEKSTIEQLNIHDKTKLQESSFALLNLQARFDALVQEINVTKKELKEKSFITIELERKNAVINDQISRVAKRVDRIRTI